MRRFKSSLNLRLDEPIALCFEARRLASDGFRDAHKTTHSFLLPVVFSGAWQTQFDPQVTSKGAFHLDNSNTVSVDMMKSPQYPLRLLNDQQLEAQVTTGARSEAQQVQFGKVLVMEFGTLPSPAGCQLPLQREHQLPDRHAFVWKRKRVVAASQAEHLRPLQAVTAGENHAGQPAQTQAAVPAGAAGGAHQHG